MKDGYTYEGQFVNDKPHGKGKCTYTNGDEYEVQYSDGNLKGQGTIDPNKPILNKPILSNWFAKSDDNQNKSSLKGPLLSYNQNNTSQQQGNRMTNNTRQKNNNVCFTF